MSQQPQQSGGSNLGAWGRGPPQVTNKAAPPPANPGAVPAPRRGGVVPASMGGPGRGVPVPGPAGTPPPPGSGAPVPAPSGPSPAQGGPAPTPGQPIPGRGLTTGSTGWPFVAGRMGPGHLRPAGVPDTPPPQQPAPPPPAPPPPAPMPPPPPPRTPAQDALRDSVVAAQLPESLQKVVLAIGRSVVQISDTLRDPTLQKDAAKPTSGQQNVFGDSQIAEDLLTDRIIFRGLKDSGQVLAASSEESPDLIPLGGPDQGGYFVAFDPLDGSSILSANFAVGSIFAVFPGRSPLGKTGRDMELAAYAVYGPKTLLVLGYKDLRPEAPGNARIVREFAWSPSRGAWVVSRENIRLQESKKVFAPANIRAAAENKRYRSVMDAWIEAMYTLRYSGGLVPDFHHILTKEGGVFCNPSSASAPAKLRLLYEVAPLSFIAEAAGGKATDGSTAILDLPISSTNARTQVVLGATKDVDTCMVALTPSG